MDKYEKTIYALGRRVKIWKELFDGYCNIVSDKSKSDIEKARYAAKANEAFIMYSELNAILNDILSLHNSEEES